MGARPAGPACVNCGATETPLWRAGPAGPKTLCNACGVRWKKTGSVVPRTRRPAAAPPPLVLPPPPPSSQRTPAAPANRAAATAAAAAAATSLQGITGDRGSPSRRHQKRVFPPGLVAPLPRRARAVLPGAIAKARARHGSGSGGAHAAAAAAVAAAATSAAATAEATAASTAFTRPAAAAGKQGSGSVVGKNGANFHHAAPAPRVQYDSIFSGLMVVRARVQTGAGTELPRPPIPCPSPPPGPAGAAAVYVTLTHAPSPSPSPPPLPRYTPKGFSMLLAAAAESNEEL